MRARATRRTCLSRCPCDHMAVQVRLAAFPRPQYQIGCERPCGRAIATDRYLRIAGAEARWEDLCREAAALQRPYPHAAD